MLSPSFGNGSDAALFLSALAGQGRVTFQTFDDTQNKRRALSRIFHGTIYDHADKLHELNQQGAGVYVMANQGDGRGRKIDNVKSVRALFVDLDGSPLEPVNKAPIAPHITVESSPGRWHAYWLVNNIALSDFTSFQLQLASMFDADPSIKDLPRVMRLPGYYHNKHGAQLCRLLNVGDSPRIKREDFIEAFGIDTTIHKGERNIRLFSAASGFKNAGVPKPAVKKRIENINASKCEEPLSSTEIDTLINNAFNYQTDGFSKIPHTLIDDPKFEQLSLIATRLLWYAFRKNLPGKEFTLIHRDYEHMKGFSKRPAFRSAIEELKDIGILEMTRNYTAGLETESRSPALYRIAEGVPKVP